MERAWASREMNKPVQKTFFAPVGMGFVKGQFQRPVSFKGGGATLARTDVAPGDRARAAFTVELKRLGWPTKKLKVRERGGKLYVNIGYLRGLEPGALFAVLKSLPDRCGGRAVLEAIQKLPERVETA
jgi:hypothetical protein